MRGVLCTVYSLALCGRRDVPLLLFYLFPPFSTSALYRSAGVFCFSSFVLLLVINKHISI
jgi:hypothetical protein